MGGVGDQMLLGGDRLLEGVERLVEAAGQPAQLARAGLLEPPRTVQRAGDLLGLLGETLDRRQRRSPDHRPQHAGQQHASAGQQDVGHQQGAEDRIDAGERQRDLDRIAVVRIADGEDLDVRPAHGGGGEEAPPGPLGDCQDLRPDRQLRRSAVAGEHGAVGVNELEVSRRAAERRALRNPGAPAAVVAAGGGA